MTENIGARVSEEVSIVCPVCTETLFFRPSIESVQILNAVDYTIPRLAINVRPYNTIRHTCKEK